MFSQIKAWLFGSNDTLGNAGAVFDAIAEVTEFEYKYVGTLGEPDIVNRGGQYTSELHVVIPLTTDNSNYPDPANLEYPLPDGLEDHNSQFFALLDRFDIEDLSLLGDIEGKNVPLALDDGTLVPLWDEVMDAETHQE